MNKAVVLVSGGLDSATVLAMARQQGLQCYALSFNYGQRSSVEVEASKRVTKSLGAVEHRIVDLSFMHSLGGSALTDPKIAVPDYVGGSEIPITYVPARNTIFLTIAMAWAEVLKAGEIFIGVSSVDYSGYPDCRPEYFTAFQNLVDLATKAGIEQQGPIIRTPLIHLSKAATIRAGLELGVDYSLTISCYQADAQGRACGRCDSCHYRKYGFAEAGVPDPTIYV